MPRLSEGNLACDFPENWRVARYDQWSFYRKQFQNCCSGNKAVDFLAFDTSDSSLWMIELKDYRRDSRKKEISLWDEVATKARDTLAGLFAAKFATEHAERLFARRSLTARSLRIVLHLEQPKTHSKLFRKVYDPAAVQQKLKQIVKPIDAHPCVIDLQNMRQVPWSAESIAQARG